MIPSFAKATEGKRFVRFALAGAGGFIVQVGTVAVLTSILGVNYLVATLVAVEAAILSNFVWHYRWTWKDRSAYSATGAYGASVFARLSSRPAVFTISP